MAGTLLVALLAALAFSMIRNPQSMGPLAGLD